MLLPSNSLAAFGLLAISSWSLSALADPTPYSGPPPPLPTRSPFGFGSAATGGGEPTENNTYVVDNMVDLRTVLRMSTPRTVYVKGELRGEQIDASGALADCQYYIDHSTTPQFNFTRYLQSLNTTYMALVKAEAAKEGGGVWEGMNATELVALLGRQNGWRATVANSQKAFVSIDVSGNLTLIGWDSSAYLHGVSLIFNSRSNVIIRNLRLTSPRDCFPAPETYPNSWNARYDAISFVTTHTAWVDGNTFEDGPEAVAPDDFLWGWKVDRYDGLFDVEDGSDNITFSHNIVANHHKSLMWGGGEKEQDRDLGKMHFTVFGNHFSNSMSRNPLMRFGTFYIVNNLFENYNNKAPLYANATLLRRRGHPSLGGTTAALRPRAEAYTPDFQYDMGIYTMSSVLASGNAFSQSGSYPNDTTRIFTFYNLSPATVGTFCSPPDTSSLTALSSLRMPKSTFNGVDINLAKNVQATFAWYISKKTDSVAGGLQVTNCTGFAAQKVPRAFRSGRDVEAYVRKNAGQVGKTTP